MKQKTQVFLLPIGRPLQDTADAYAGSIAERPDDRKALRLNEDLVEAIALGHDLGHTPFGHAGEKL